MNSTEIYIQFEPHCASPHYLKRYLKFIAACTHGDEYVERHHICPESMFPQYRNLRLNPWNCVELTARQHFIAHWMLAKAVETQGMWYALKLLLSASNDNQPRHQSILASSIARKNHAASVSKHWKQIDPETGLTFGKLRAANQDHDVYNDNLGCTLREWKSKRMTIDNPGSRQEVKVKISATMKEHYKDKPGTFNGKVHTNETKLKQSQVKLGENNATTGTVWVNNGTTQLRAPADNIPEGFAVGRLSFTHKKQHEERTCPHCNKTGKGGNMERYHFNNCKSRGAVQLA